MSTGDLQIYPGGGYTGTADSSSIRTMQTVFNVSTSILGVWIQGTTAMGGATSSTGNAIVADANGNVIGRGPATNVSNSGWYYLPLSSAVAVTAGVTYYIGFGSFSGNNRFNEGLSPTVLTSNTVNGINFTTYNTQRIANGDPNSVSPISNVSTNNYIFGMGVKVQMNNAPNAPTSVGYNGTYFNNGSTLTVNATVTDPDGDNLTAYHLVGSVNGYANYQYDSGIVACNVGSGGTISVNIPCSSMQESNNWQFAMMVKDSNGVWGGWGYGGVITVDKTNPYVSSVAGAGNINISSGTFRVWAHGVGDALSGVQAVYFPTCRVGIGDWGTWYPGTNAGNGDWYCDIPIGDYGNAEATYETDIYVRDNAGNQPYVGSALTTVDRTAPTIGSVDVQQYINGNSATVHAYNVADSLSGIDHVVCVAVRPDGSYYTLGNMTNYSGSNWSYNVTDITIDGNWHYDIYAYDKAGNYGYMLGGNNVFRDTVQPNASTISLGVPTSTKIPIGWTAFSDNAPSSGFLQCLVYMRTWNGSTWVDISGSPKDVGNVNTYTWTGLTPNTNYHVIVQYRDKSGNWGNYQEIAITTNQAPTAALENVSNTGYLINQRPIFQVTGTDYNATGQLEFNIIISKNADFSSALANCWATHTSETGYAGWGIHGTVASGGVNIYTPQIDIGTGTVYVRVAAYDTIDGIVGPVHDYQFTINTPSWPTTISDDDTTVSLRTVQDLRSKINYVRQARGLTTKTWTDNLVDWSYGTNATDIRAVHLTELRTAVQEIWTLLGKGSIAWTDQTITANTTDRKGKHWSELRNNLILC